MFSHVAQHCKEKIADNSIKVIEVIMNSKLIGFIELALAGFFLWVSFNEDFIVAHLGNTGSFLVNMIPMAYIAYIIWGLFPTKTINPRIKNEE